MSVKTWAADLENVRIGALAFDVFARRHDRMLNTIARANTWMGAGQEAVDDVKQEVALAIWQAVDVWDPAIGTPLAGFVSMRIRHAMFRILKRYRTMSRSAAVVQFEEGGRGIDIEVEIDFDAALDRRDRAAAEIGRRSSDEARAIARLVGGSTIEETAAAVFGNRARARAQWLREARRMVRIAG